MSRKREQIKNGNEPRNQQQKKSLIPLRLKKQVGKLLLELRARVTERGSCF